MYALTESLCPFTSNVLYAVPRDPFILTQVMTSGYPYEASGADDKTYCVLRISSLEIGSGCLRAREVAQGEVTHGKVHGSEIGVAQITVRDG